MKKYKHATYKPVRTINITIEFEYNHSNGLAASTYAVHPSNMKKKYKLNDMQLVRYNDIIANICIIIESHHFRIIDEYQSKKSYAYYVAFVPISSEGVELSPIEVVFRIAEHSNPSAEEINPSPSSITRIKSLIVDTKKFANTQGLYNEANYICDQLAQGNIEAL